MAFSIIADDAYKGSVYHHALKVTVQTLFLGFDAHGKSTGYCAGDPVPEFISDRSGAFDPHGCATTAEIEFLGEPLMTRAVHTTYTKL